MNGRTAHVAVGMMAGGDEREWPAAAGTYALIFRLNEASTIRAGRLGPHVLPAGTYVYVGSAHGPGGLRGRLSRHLSRNKRAHWHIDSLTAVAPVAELLLAVSPQRLECRWVHRLLALAGASIPVRGFGSSDCREGCPGHLIRLPEGLDASHLQGILTDERP